MAYSTQYFQGKSPKVSNIFSLRLTAFQFLILLFVTCGVTQTYLTILTVYYPAKVFLRSRNRSARLFLGTNNNFPWLSWTIYFTFAQWGLFNATLTTFGDDYSQAWRDHLEAKGGTLDLQIFVGKDTFSAPILCKLDSNNVCIVGSDAETFGQLRLWYDWMQYKRGFGEIVIPRRLIRVDKVKTLGSSRVLGKTVDTYDLGRRGSTGIAFLLDPSQVPGAEITTQMVAARADHGLEFVRAWDRHKLSIIALLPFVFSVIFAVTWIGVSIGKFKVDAQVAVQTGFTVAGFIVTAGALLIALFAFLDNQSG